MLVVCAVFICVVSLAERDVCRSQRRAEVGDWPGLWLDLGVSDVLEKNDRRKPKGRVFRQQLLEVLTRKVEGSAWVVDEELQKDGYAGYRSDAR